MDQQIFTKHYTLEEKEERLFFPDLWKPKVQ